MAERDRERIGSVVGELHVSVNAERAAHHDFDLALSAGPWPATVSLTSLGVYSNNSRPRAAAASIAIARASPEGERALHVERREAALEAHRVRGVLVDYFDYPFVDRGKPLRPAPQTSTNSTSSDVM